MVRVGRRNVRWHANLSWWGATFCGDRAWRTHGETRICLGDERPSAEIGVSRAKINVWWNATFWWPGVALLHDMMAKCQQLTTYWNFRCNPFTRNENLKRSNGERCGKTKMTKNCNKNAILLGRMSKPVVKSRFWSFRCNLFART